MALETVNQFDIGTDFSQLGRGFQQGQQVAGQFQLGQQREQAINKEAEQQRIMSVVQGASEIQNIPSNEGKLSALINRRNQLVSDNKPTQDTDEAIGLFQSGNFDEGNALIDGVVNMGIQQGLLKAPAAGPSQLEQAKTAQVIAQTEQLGQPKPVSPLDQARIKKIEAEISTDPESDKLRREEFELKKDIESRQKTKLSAGLEKALLDSQDLVVKAKRNSTEFDILASQVESGELAGGVQSTTSETLKRLLGTQDDVTELRRRFNSVRLSEGLKNLPPGPATDKDMEQAFKGVPPENAPASQIASFLRGAAKMARFDAGYNQFKSDFISDKSTAKGLNKEWRRTVQSEALGRTISIAEIYAEAAAEGMTPEDVKAELGVE